MGEVAELAVDGDEALGAGDGQERLQLLLLGVAAHVDLGQPGVDDLGAQPVQAVDDLADTGLVAGDGVRRRG